MNGPSEEEVDRLERKMIEAMQGSAGSSRKIRGECMHCQKVVVRLPDFDADAPPRWMHEESGDYRCALFAEPSSCTVVVGELGGLDS
ncbi:Uncharacterised protein [Mycobacteroides abscessus subsp. massiliense]|uniref:hypothetical protein n=1 Tax=Mycobacteroides abscessus TaxID=36809 RepID=UPI0009A8E70C|nr:hypothetical protein [Mycobacteroides abscessus]MBE5502524.1 hypothetical protein [Mycobacteroides abscessus]SLH52060.1 Uncharacterised protein [Mycobacteroides abscessus subsp. massiliense]